MIFFISDLHFGHRAICKYRTQFASPQEHDEYIIEKWNSVVTKAKFTTWCLGDMCIKNKYYDFPKLISRLNGTIKLITGNHEYLPAYKDISPGKLQIMPGLVKKYGVWLSHCPIHPNELRGHPCVHGHVHYKSLDDARYLNVCCENVYYTPIHLDRIKEILL